MAFFARAGAGDRVFAGLGQHLDGDVVRDVVAFDQLADEVEVGIGSRRKATSICFRPTCTRVLKNRIFFAASIGSISDWLPSRRSELHQIGTSVMVFDGQVRSGAFEWQALKEN